MESSRSDSEYLSGVIDAKGTFLFYKDKAKNWFVRLDISDTNPDLINEVHRIAGCGSVHFRKTHKPPYWRISFSSNAIKNLLLRLNLRARRESAELLLKAVDLIKEKKRSKFMRRPEIEERLVEIHNKLIALQ